MGASVLVTDWYAVLNDRLDESGINATHKRDRRRRRSTGRADDIWTNWRMNSAPERIILLR